MEYDAVYVYDNCFVHDLCFLIMSLVISHLALGHLHICTSAHSLTSSFHLSVPDGRLHGKSELVPGFVQLFQDFSAFVRQDIILSWRPRSRLDPVVAEESVIL